MKIKINFDHESYFEKNGNNIVSNPSIDIITQNQQIIDIHNFAEITSIIHNIKNHIVKLTFKGINNECLLIDEQKESIIEIFEIIFHNVENYSANLFKIENPKNILDVEEFFISKLSSNLFEININFSEEMNILLNFSFAELIIKK